MNKIEKIKEAADNETFWRDYSMGDMVNIVDTLLSYIEELEAEKAELEEEVEQFKKYGVAKRSFLNIQQQTAKRCVEISEQHRPVSLSSEYYGGREEAAYAIKTAILSEFKEAKE